MILELLCQAGGAASPQSLAVELSSDDKGFLFLTKINLQCVCSRLFQLSAGNSAVSAVLLGGVRVPLAALYVMGTLFLEHRLWLDGQMKSQPHVDL